MAYETYADIKVALNAAPAAVANIAEGVRRLRDAHTERKAQVLALETEYGGLNTAITALPPGEAKDAVLADFIALNGVLQAAETEIDTYIAAHPA